MLGAARVAKNEGVPVLISKSVRKIRAKQNSVVHKQKIQMLVGYDDALKADWSIKLPVPEPVNKDKYTFNWVMSPPGEGSGGHQNLFRFIRYLEQAGHECRIYLYSTHDKRSVAEIRQVLRVSYPETKASIEWPSGEMLPADGIFATGWETAYPVFNSTLTAQRFYFVQDFEPYFYPVGSEYILAENTYRFGFYGITAGGFLAKKLHDEFGMETDNFNFGSDSKVYRHTNKLARKEVVFYARPVTSRRAFELGVMALDIFHRLHPEYVINLVGWDVSNYELPFPYVNLKTLPLEELSDVYNRCAVALVMSLTNMSLLPLELLACGTIPVVNDGPNNRLVSDNPYIAFSPAIPKALADKMSSIVTQTDLLEYSLKASQSVSNASWDDAGQKFVSIVEHKLRNE